MGRLTYGMKWESDSLWQVGEDMPERGTRDLSGIMEISCMSYIVVLTEIYTIVKIYWSEHLKLVNLCKVYLNKERALPGWCGSVDWALACKPKGCWFGSQSGHMPGLQARSPVGDAWETTTHWCFSPSLSPSLPLCLKIKEREREL